MLRVNHNPNYLSHLELTYYPDQFWSVNYRFFAPEADGKTKLDHVSDMLDQLAPRGAAYCTVLMDS